NSRYKQKRRKYFSYERAVALMHIYKSFKRIFPILFAIFANIKLNQLRNRTYEIQINTFGAVFCSNGYGIHLM
ncbi:MAG: hypothetical protein ACI31A_03550, partial [Candidatus Limisoma sp.]